MVNTAREPSGHHPGKVPSRKKDSGSHLSVRKITRPYVHVTVYLEQSLKIR